MVGVGAADLEFDYVSEKAVHQAEFDRETQERERVVEVDVEFDVEVSVERDEANEPLVDKLRAEEPISGGQLSTLSTASEEIELDEPLEIEEVKLDGSTFISHFSDTTVREHLLDPMLENWHEHPETVELMRE